MEMGNLQGRIVEAILWNTAAVRKSQTILIVNFSKTAADGSPFFLLDVIDYPTLVNKMAFEFINY
ncbi:hypothetical protein SDC9_116042 [bioreactor metagenome]|uniref:Uncharacterized protein n=1 Tax=bioreactor metagenome TaxID=1076179 RepID=A0A645BVI7_9ZZZZ